MEFYNKTEEIFISSKCNMNCDHCHVKKYFGERDEKEFDDMMNDGHFDLAQDGDVISTHFIGGEPLLELEKIKKYISKYNEIKKTKNITNIYSITTNLTLSTLKNDESDEYINLLKSIDYVSTSFDIGGIRFKNIKDLVRWYNNVKLLNRIRIENGKSLVKVFICVTSKSLPRRFDLIKMMCDLNLEYVFIPLTKTAPADLLPSNNPWDMLLYIPFYGIEYKTREYLNLVRGKENLNKTIELLEPLSAFSCYFNEDTYVYGIQKEIKCPVNPNCNGKLCSDECNECNIRSVLRCIGKCPEVECIHISKEVKENNENE